LIPESLIGKRVVVDTNSSYTIVGTLIEKQQGCLILEQVDLHDQNSANTHQDLYLSDVLDNGVQANRKKIHVLLDKVICITDLDDIISY